MESDKGCKMVPLGKDSRVKIMVDSYEKEVSTEDRLSTLENKVADLRTLVTTILKMVKNNQDTQYYQNPPKDKKDKFIEKQMQVDDNQRLNKDMIPINTVLTGVVNGVPHVLYVHRDHYTVGNKGYETLSGAAKGITGKRRNGWEFWRTPDGTKIGDTVTIPIYNNS